LESKQFRNAAVAIAGIELMHHVRKGHFGLRHFGGRIRLTAGFKRVYQHAPLQRRRAFAPHHPQERCQPD